MNEVFTKTTDATLEKESAFRVLPKEVLINTADAVLEKGVSFRIRLRPKNRIHKLLQKLKILPVEKRYTLGPLCLGSLVKISKIILLIEVETMDNGKILENIYRAISEHTDHVIEAIGHAIINGKEDPPPAMLELLKSEMTAQDMAKCLTVLIDHMDLRSFIHSITLIRGLYVMKTDEVSPADQRS